MRWLTIGVAVLAALWSGWWFAGSRAFERGAVAGIEAARSRGWDIAYDDLSVTGFPNRFDTIIDTPRLTTPDGTVAWSAPFLQIFALAYRPNQVIAVAANDMVFDLPAGRVDVTAEDLRASATFTPSTSPDLNRATIMGTALAASGAGLDATVDAAQLALRRIDGGTEYDIALNVTRLRPGEALRATFDPFASLPPLVDGLDVDLKAAFDRPLGTGGRPEVTALDLREARLVWGGLRLVLSGRVDVDAEGLPEGTLTLDAEGWQAALRLAASLGLVEAEQLPLLTAGLAGMAADDGRLTLDLVLEEGGMRLGPIPLGPAPRL